MIWIQQHNLSKRLNLYSKYSSEKRSEKIHKYFPIEKIKQIQNHYLNRQIRIIQNIPPSRPFELLYLMEPIRQVNWCLSGAGEFIAFRFFLENINTLNLSKDVVIKIRPHPSDPKGKYDELCSNTDFNIKIDDDHELANSIGKATWVVGCETYGLVISHLSGKDTYCSLPFLAAPSRLPYKEIKLIARR